MKKAELDLIAAVDLLGLSDDTEIEDFDKERWRSVWFQAVEYWWEDGQALYNVMKSGFKGFLDRSDFTIYCDLRFTFVDVQSQNMTWDELAAKNHELGKHS